MIGKPQLISTEARPSGRILAKDIKYESRTESGCDHVRRIVCNFIFFFKCLAAVSLWR